MSALLTEAERLHLARAVYSVTNFRPPKNARDLSNVRNEIEHAVERILSDRLADVRAEAAREALREAALALAARRDQVPGIAVPARAAFEVCINLLDFRADRIGGVA